MFISSHLLKYIFSPNSGDVFFLTLRTCDYSFFFFLNLLSWEDIDYLSHYIGLTSQVLAKPQDKDS